METLQAELQPESSHMIDELEVQAFALEAYLLCAARGLYINLKWPQTH